MVAAAATLLALAGCFPDPPRDDGLAVPGALTPLVEITDPDALRYCPPRLGLHLDGVVAPTDAVYICRADGRFPSDGLSSYGPWQTVYRVPHPERLLAAYATPNAPARTSGCPTDVVDPLLIWVDEGGVVTAYYAPVDGCGSPIPMAATAYRTAPRDAVLEIDTGRPDYRPGEDP